MGDGVRWRFFFSLRVKGCTGDETATPPPTSCTEIKLIRKRLFDYLNIVIIMIIIIIFFFFNKQNQNNYYVFIVVFGKNCAYVYYIDTLNILHRPKQSSTQSRDLLHSSHHCSSLFYYCYTPLHNVLQIIF